MNKTINFNVSPLTNITNKYKNTVSIYSDMTDEVLEKLHNRITADYGKDLFNVSRSEKNCLSALAVKNIKPYKLKEEMFYVQEFVKEYIYRQLLRLSLAQYLIMEKSNDFGIHGKEAVSISFCRNLLNIKNRNVNNSDYDFFNIIIGNLDCTNKMSVKELMKYRKYFSLKIFNKTYPSTSFNSINDLFELLEVNYYLYKTTNMFIFGYTEKEKIGDITIYNFKKEYTHCPNSVLAIVACVYNNGWIVRHEACKVIFNIKWKGHFKKTEIEREFDLKHISSAIREGIKDHVLYYYNTATAKDVLKKRKNIISDIIASIRYHEIGHLILKEDMGIIYSAFIRGKLVNDNQVLHVLSEILADYALSKDQRKGTFAYFSELAQEDIQHATACFYMYLSDNWFIDADEENSSMELLSYAILSLALNFIKTDSSVDFKRIAIEYEIIYKNILKLYNIIINDLINIIRNSTYNIGKKQFDYNNLVNELLKEIKKGKCIKFNCPHLVSQININYKKNINSISLKDLPELEKIDHFWEFMRDCLEKYSKTGWEQYQKVFKEGAESLEILILSEILIDNKRKCYASLREYTEERCKEIGIVKVLPTIKCKTTEIYSNFLKVLLETFVLIKKMLKD